MKNSFANGDVVTSTEQIEMLRTTLTLEETLCATWYYFYKLKNVKNTHGEVSFFI